MKNRAGKDFAMLLIGLGMLGAGLVLFFRNVYVYTTDSLFWGFGSMRVGGLGLLFVPLILAIVLWVIYPKSIWPKILAGVTVVALIVGIISMIRFSLRNDLLNLVIQIILIFAGGALTLKVLVIDDPKRKNKSSDNEE